jgi:hypothetical protein
LYLDEHKRRKNPNYQYEKWKKRSYHIDNKG